MKRLFEMMTTYPPPDCHLVSAGRDAILDYLCGPMGMRDLGGRPITWRDVRRWAERYDFPLHPGVPGVRRRYGALTSDLADQAWMPSRPHHGTRGLFAA